MIKKENAFLVYGEVILSETKTGVPNVIVEALDKDFIIDDRLGCVITDKNGKFEIHYDKDDFQELFFDKKPDIYLRIRRADGKIIHASRDKVRYDAGKTERFIVMISKSLLEENTMNKADYKIEGHVNTGVLQTIPVESGVRIYAVRDRRVLGSSLLDGNGNFCIMYNYEFYEKDENKSAIAPNLMAGPDIEGDHILKHKFQKVFIRADDFNEMDGEWRLTVSKETVGAMFDKSIIEGYWKPWLKVYCHEWRPCIQVLSCSEIEAGSCYNEQPLINVYVRIYEVRFPMIYLIGRSPIKYTVMVAEGETDQFGYFKNTKKICNKFLLFRSLGYRVEVGQVIDGTYQSIYMDPEDQLRTLKSDLCEEVYINKSEVVMPEEGDDPQAGETFNFTRIGDIPLCYINQDGYANTMGATDSATLKVVDSAFYAKIKLYANIGADIKNKVKYYRIKCSYENGGVLVENYIQVPFNNLRESTDSEKLIFGPYKTEFMGPVDGFYSYPNPYDVAVDKQWVYKGLIMVLNTATLPLPFAKYTFTVGVYDENKIPVSLSNTDGISFTIIVDNTAPSGSIGDIIGPSGSIPACGFLKLPSIGTRSQTCNGAGVTRNLVHGNISVPFSALDEHGLIESITLSANYGCNEFYTLVGAGKKPKINCNGSEEYQNYNDVPVTQRPNWSGNDKYCASASQDWDECAYQFLLLIYKRVTNGEVAYPWWNFTKNITIIRE